MRLLRRALLLLVLLLLGAGAALWWTLRASLPAYHGERTLGGLAAPASVERDRLGSVTVRARSRADAYRALGFVHAQERWFEMDLSRRQAAGELAALLGSRLLATDREHRAFRLRARAETALAALPASQRELLAAYRDGVNAGLAALGTRPWQYVALGRDPEPWRTEDSLLVGYAMFLLLANPRNERELAFGQLRAHVPASLAALFDPGLGADGAHAGSEWDAPLDGPALPAPALPTADDVDLARLDPALFGRQHAISGDLVAGSNAFAVGRSRSASRGALVANDMHLGLGVPNIWFRARLEYPDAAAPDGRVAVGGASLPGVPGIVVGSNGYVAWGFTNGYVDASDWVVVHWSDASQTRYCTATAAIVSGDGDARHCTESAPLVVHRERIEVADGAPVELEVRETRWGPVLATDVDGHALANAWIGHAPGAIDLSLLDLDRVTGVEAAIALAQQAGMPPQNFVVGDVAGRIGWTVTGRLPRRNGFFPRAPADWSKAPGVGWVGWLDAAERPQRIDPPAGAIWTANARTVSGAELARLGDGGYALGARARQIRDALLARGDFDPAAMLAIALDDRALFLSRWQQRLLARLAAGPQDAERAALAAAVANWGARAAVDSVGYRAVRGFRDAVLETLVDGLTAPVRAAVPDFETPRLEQFEGVAWRLLEEQPRHLLPPPYADYAALENAAIDRVLAGWRHADGGIERRTWGERNTARIQHPLSRAVPALSALLDMPREPLPGDAFMPRVQAPAFGASQRMVVSPGRESEGLFHMPGGQSGHPLSPYYGAGHDDWVAARATPFLPGPPEATLRLVPPSR